MTDRDMYKFSESETLLRGTRWAREEEMKRLLSRVCLTGNEECYPCGLPVISDGNTVYVDDSDAHSLIIGSTGSKKTRLFAMPMLELIRRAGESIVVTDPKGELYQTTAALFEQQGYHIQVINLRDPLHSNGWNPLALARRYQNAGEPDRASSIVNDFSAAFIEEKPGSKADPFWLFTARSMLQGLVLMMVEGTHIFPDECVNLATLRSLSQELHRNQEKPSTFDLLKFYPQNSTTVSNLNAIARGSAITFDNIKASYDAPMQRLYVQRGLVSLLSNDDIDFELLGKEKTILYLIMPDEKTTLHIIVSMIIKQCYEQLIYLAQHYPDNALPVRVNFLLDEFSNLPAIPDMPAMISAARSRNIRFHLIIQGLYQLSSKYGPDDAQTIKGNCANWVFLTSRELPLLEEISQLCGCDALTGERLITVSQLQRLDKQKGEALMLIGRQYPFIAHLADISMYHMPHPGGDYPYPSLSTHTPSSMNTTQALATARRTKANASRSTQRSTQTSRESVEAFLRQFDPEKIKAIISYLEEENA
ncbi:MAG: type IV secretory system conjugative DNA transfer family protein [Clostridia bacterium]|nr:type IV secretory system conjugative DNA transfer family protein [Clostridia bacterium]